MDSESHVSIDLRALADLRSRAQRSEAEASEVRAELERLDPEFETAKKELDRVGPELEATKKELHRLGSDYETAKAELEDATSELASSRAELARLRQDRDVLVKREDDLRSNSAELTEALRQAQTRYWDTSRELDMRNDEVVACTAELEREQQHTASLKERYQRITGSRAWRLISAYRRFVNRLRRRSP